jgi:subtilisin family serine protease
MIALLGTLGYSAIDAGMASGALLVDVPAGHEQETADLLKTTSGAAFAEPVYMASALGLVPNDTYYSLQTNLAAINATGGWQYFTGSSGVIVAIIDTGLDLTSADFSGRLVEGYDFVNYDSTPMDDNGHGSHVAGIMAATGNNDYGIAGLDWSAKIMPIKVLDSTGHGSDLNVYRGIMYAVDHGAKVINLSLGFDGYSYLVESAVNYAYQHGVTIVASSGNSNLSVTFPANLPHVIAVGSVDDSENKAVYSNYGDDLDLVAPGNSVFSLTNTGYSYKTGTSMAAPQVSGLASLLRGITSLSPDQTEILMKSTSKDLGSTGWDMYFGNGLIQVRDAILRLLNSLGGSGHEDPAEENPAPTTFPTFTPTMTPTMTPTPAFLP